MNRTRHRSANTVTIDPESFRHFFWMRRLALAAVGPLFGRCGSWASVTANRGHAGYYALDELACALGIRVDDLIAEIGAPEELERLSV